MEVRVVALVRQLHSQVGREDAVVCAPLLVSLNVVLRKEGATQPVELENTRVGALAMDKIVKIWYWLLDNFSLVAGSSAGATSCSLSANVSGMDGQDRG